MNINMYQVLGGLLCLLFSHIVSAQNKSVYTNLGADACKAMESIEGEGDSYRGVCPGVAGYKLEVEEADLRQSVSLIFPSGQKSSLDFYRVSPGFSDVGEKAEWRMKGNTPVAVIIRFNVSEHPEKPEKITSYLIVAKIGKNTACISDVVKPSKTQNQQARDLADAATTKACKTFD